jgi:hypothetical protein
MAKPIDASRSCTSLARGNEASDHAFTSKVIAIYVLSPQSAMASNSTHTVATRC